MNHDGNNPRPRTSRLPVRCRFGFHDWRTHWSTVGLKNAGMMLYCVRCGEQAWRVWVP